MQVTLGADCAVVEIPRFVPEEWKNALDWYDATVRVSSALIVSVTLASCKHRDAYFSQAGFFEQQETVSDSCLPKIIQNRNGVYDHLSNAEYLN